VRDEESVNRAIDAYADMIRRICFYHLKNAADTEDVFQNVFLKYMLSGEQFADEHEERAWIARVAINACMDHLRFLKRHPSVPIDLLPDEAASVTPQQRTVLEAVLALPEKYRNPIYLFYYEGYTAAEIARILRRTEGTIYSLLNRGRSLLRKTLGGDDDEEPDQGRI